MTKAPQKFRIQEWLLQKPMICVNFHDSRQDVFVLQQTSVTRGVTVQLDN